MCCENCKLRLNISAQMENKQGVINTENDGQAKMPYNLRERKIKSAPYRDLIRTELADELYERIYELVVTQKRYKQPNFSARFIGCGKFQIQDEFFMFA